MPVAGLNRYLELIASPGWLLVRTGLIVVIITGCALTNKTPSTYSANTLLSSEWRVSGKLAIQQRATTPNKATAVRDSQTLRFDWQQLDTDYRIRLIGPLGFGTMLIEKTDDQVMLSRGKKQLGIAKDSDTLFYRQTGWQLPVSYLRYWAVGRPSPESSFYIPPWTDDAAPKGFEQDGWQVSYPKTRQIQGYQLPEKIIAQHRDFRLVVALKNWRINDVE